MSFVNNVVLDPSLQLIVDNATHFHICSSEPSNFAGVAAVTLGTKASPTIGSPADATPTGRKVTVAAITDGTISSTGTASHFAITDNTNSRLLVAGALGASQAVTSGNPFTTTAFDIVDPGV